MHFRNNFFQHWGTDEGKLQKTDWFDSAESTLNHPSVEEKDVWIRHYIPKGWNPDGLATPLCVAQIYLQFSELKVAKRRNGPFFVVQEPGEGGVHWRIHGPAALFKHWQLTTSIQSEFARKLKVVAYNLHDQEVCTGKLWVSQMILWEEKKLEKAVHGECQWYSRQSVQIHTHTGVFIECLHISNHSLTINFCRKPCGGDSLILQIPTWTTTWTCGSGLRANTFHIHSWNWLGTSSSLKWSSSSFSSTTNIKWE